MIAQLSEEQRCALLAGVPVEVQEGGMSFYLIGKDEYEAILVSVRLYYLLGGNPEPGAMGAGRE